MDLTDLPLAEIVAAVGTLGVAAVGVVEGLKTWDWFGLKGFGCIKKTFGASLMDTLKVAYGNDYEELLKAQYKSHGDNDKLTSTLRQGVRLGLKPENAEAIANAVGVVDGKILKTIADILTSAGTMTLTNEQTGLLGRFELAVDAKVDAAVSLAEVTYQRSMRNCAFVASIVIAAFSGMALAEFSLDKVQWIWVFIIGVTAVPIAPIAKDLSTGLKAAATALKGRK